MKVLRRTVTGIYGSSKFRAMIDCKDLETAKKLLKSCELDERNKLLFVGNSLGLPIYKKMVEEITHDPKAAPEILEELKKAKGNIDGITVINSFPLVQHLEGGRAWLEEKIVESFQNFDGSHLEEAITSLRVLDSLRQNGSVMNPVAGLERLIEAYKEKREILSVKVQSSFARLLFSDQGVHPFLPEVIRDLLEKTRFWTNEDYAVALNSAFVCLATGTLKPEEAFSIINQINEIKTFFKNSPAPADVRHFLSSMQFLNFLEILAPTDKIWENLYHMARDPSIFSGLGLDSLVILYQLLLRRNHFSYFESHLLGSTIEKRFETMRPEEQLVAATLLSVLAHSGSFVINQQIFQKFKVELERNPSKFFSDPMKLLTLAELTKVDPQFNPLFETLVAKFKADGLINENIENFLRQKIK